MKEITKEFNKNMKERRKILNGPNDQYKANKNNK